MPPSVKEAIAICENANLSVYEKSFIVSVKNRMANGTTLSTKQVTWLFDIEKKVSKAKKESQATSQNVNETSRERVGISQGMRGWFAVLYNEEGPINSGIGSYSTPGGAHSEAKDWAMAEGIPCDELLAA